MNKKQKEEIAKTSLDVAEGKIAREKAVEELAILLELSPEVIGEELDRVLKPMQDAAAKALAKKSDAERELEEKNALAADAAQKATAAKKEAESKARAAQIAAANAEGKVVAIVPRKFRLNHDGTVTEYKVGTCLMPLEHAQHPYAVSNGVTFYESK